MKKEEAIKKIKERINAGAWCSSDDLELLSVLVPELAENEGDKIRKEIISALKFANDGGVYDKHIAYLEKQKDASKEYWRGYREGKQEILDKYAEIEKQKDYRKLYEDIVKSEWFKKNYVGKFLGENPYDFAMSQQEEQKPAEWSEEDDQLIGFIFDLLNDLVWRKDWAMSKEECLKRLKSLRTPFKDREMKLKILKYLSTRCSSLEFEEVEDYLNNLRPQPHWKPGKEEMDAFETALKGEFQNGVYPASALCKLFGELKKLYYNDEIPTHWKPSEEQLEALKYYVDMTTDGEIELLYNDLKKLM